MRTRFPILRRALRITLPAILALSGLNAEASTPVIGTSNLEVRYITGGFNICVDGDVSPDTTGIPGTWVLVIAGARVHDDASKVPVNYPPFYYPGYSVLQCEQVYTEGAPYGQFDIEVFYLASEIHPMPPVDVPPWTGATAQSFGGAVWSPSTGQRSWVVNPVSPSGPTASFTH